MSGLSIEFIANTYPLVLTVLKDLISRNQIELISSTYSPQIWVAFPKKDMVKSIKLNNRILEKYGLPKSDIFYSRKLLG